MKKEYFDFHVHLLAKQYLSQYDEVVPNIDRDINKLSRDIVLSKGFMRKVDKELLHLLHSQSSIDQVRRGKVRYVVANLVGLEYAYGASKGLFGKIFKSKLTDPLDKTYFQKVEDGEISYVNMFLRELVLYRQLQERGDLYFAKRYSESQKFEDKEKPIVIFGIEGGHMLSMKKIGNDSEIDPLEEYIDYAKIKGALANQGLKPAEVKVRLREIGLDDFQLFDRVKNLDKSLKQNPAEVLKTLHETMFDHGMDIVCMNLAHLSYIREQDLATHAFGLKMIKQAAFYPVGNGITKLGESVVRAAYGMKQNVKGKSENTPIFIDVKHMSLKSRMDLYALREAECKKYEALKPKDKKAYTGWAGLLKNKNLPIIATHVGVTGYSINQWKDAIKEDSIEYERDQGVSTIKFRTDRKRAGHWGSEVNRNFTYNPWTINLMDEDIIQIMDSGGMIGLILDVRVLGFQARIRAASRLSPEYMSVAEFGYHFPEVDVSKLQKNSLQESLIEEESWLVNTKDERHPLMLCFNIIHTVVTGELNGIEDAYKHVCIGSDFDGLINPVKVCRNSSEMSNLEANLTRWLPIAADAYQEENGGGDFLYAQFKNKKQLLPLIRGIMMDNGELFLKERGFI